MAALTGDDRRRGFDSAEAFDKEDSSEGKGARRRIFFFSSEESGKTGSAKGYLRSPTLGVIMYFWLA